LRSGESAVSPRRAERRRLGGAKTSRRVDTDILHGAIFKSFGAARHRMLGTVHARLALWMLLGSAPLSLVGVQIASGLGDGTDSTMQKIVGADVTHAAALLWVAGVGRQMSIKVPRGGCVSRSPSSSAERDQARRRAAVVPDHRHRAVRRRRRARRVRRAVVAHA